MPLGKRLLQALKAHGAREIFGLPGDFALPFFKVIEETGILPFYTLSHEPAVGFAADAAARFGGGLGVAVVTYGAGALNMVNAIACAYAERSPVVVISGAPSLPERMTGLLLHHQAKTLDSQYRVFREITCDQTRLDEAQRAPAEIARVLRSCREHSMPVYIEIPRDMVTARCGAVEALPPSPVDLAAVSECVADILVRLQAAHAPLMMVDVEIRRYGLEDKVARLAEWLAIPVVTTFMGRGLLAGTRAPLLGTYLGVAGVPELTERVESADALFMLGVIPSDTNFGVATQRLDRRRMLHAGYRRVSIGYHEYQDIPLETLVDALLARLEAAAGPAGTVGTATASHSICAATPAVAAPLAPEAGSVVPAAIPDAHPADDRPLTPSDIARAVNALMARHGVMPIAADMGDCLFTAHEIAYTGLAAPAYYATMGFGVPAGLAAQARTGQRPLILVGDGAFQMTGWELGNCRRYGWDPLVLVFNNNSWEMLRAFQPESQFTGLEDWNFASMAAGMGGVGERVTTPAALAAALERAIAARGQFRLVEAMLPPGQVSDTLARFIAGVKRLRSASE